MVVREERGKEGGSGFRNPDLSSFQTTTNEEEKEEGGGDKENDDVSFPSCPSILLVQNEREAEREEREGDEGHKERPKSNGHRKGGKGGRQ